MKTPLLTIMMPSYNYAPFLRQSIDSVLSQEFTDFELLIIEDASTDGSPQIIKDYMQHDSRIRTIFRKKNVGLLAGLNEGTALAEGKYIHYLAADDFRYPGFLEKCMDQLLKNKELGMCCTQFHYGDEQELLLETVGVQTGSPPLILKPSQVANAFFTQNLKLFGVNSILKTGLVRKYQSFDPQLSYLCDWYLLNEIAFNHSFAIIPEPLVRFRIHSSNFSNVFRHNKQNKRAAYKHLLEKLNHKDNYFLKQQYKKSGLLSFVFQDLFWKLLLNPKYISYWPYINKKYPIKKRIAKSFRKKLGLPYES